MRAWIVTVSIGALVLAGLDWPVPGAALFGLGFAIAAGVLSAVNAGRLRHPIWSGLLALITIAGVVSFCNGLSIWGSYIDLYGPNGPSPDTVREWQTLMIAPVVVLPLPALLSTFLLRPGKPRPAEPVEPPAGTS